MNQPSLFDDLEPEKPAPPTRGFHQVIAEAWVALEAPEVRHLLSQSTTTTGRRKIADMIISNRPDLAAHTESELAIIENPAP